jgi:L-ascorbate metabolism protein UlaG (beta-lactamase superfamily)
MKRWIIQGLCGTIILGLVALAAGNQAGLFGGSKPTAPLGLAYIANEGVLLSSGETKVLIDAVFDKPHPDYRAPAAEVLDKMMKGIAPFDGVDLLLVTHNHPDHFAAPLAARFMAASPKTVLAAPADAVAELRKTAEWAKIEPRVVSIDLKVGEKTSRDIGGIPVKAFRTLHSGDRELPMNLVFLVELGGWRIFHEGDSPENIEAIRAFALDSKPIDLALVHYWFPLEPKAAKLLQEELTPDHIALMHLSIRLENDAPGKIDQVRKYYKDIFLLRPGMPAKEFRK